MLFKGYCFTSFIFNLEEFMEMFNVQLYIAHQYSLYSDSPIVNMLLFALPPSLAKHIYVYIHIT